MIEHVFANGRFKFHLSYRRLAGDEGLAIRVTGPADDGERELLRYDCFKKKPHYHVGVFAENNITKISANDPVAWSLNEIGEHFERLIQAAGGEAPDDREISNLDTAMLQVREAAKALVDANG